MRTMLSAAALAALSPILAAQISQIAAMTVPHSFVDMDTVGPAGPTTLPALIIAGTNGGAPMLGITLTPSTAAAGVYNTNVTLGRALGFDGVGLALIDPSGSFVSFNAQIDLALPSTEFGIAIADWVSTMVLDFSLFGAPVGTITSSSYSTANAKFFRSTMPFDRVNVRASTTGGNWVIPELYIQNGVGWGPFGSGCTGSNGAPQLSGSVPAIGQQFTLSASQLPLAGGLWAAAFGFSTTSMPGLGPLPFDLLPFGAPGCQVLVSANLLVFSVQTGGSGSLNVAIPNNQGLVGVNFANQAWVMDPPANALGVTVSNGGTGTIQ